MAKTYSEKLKDPRWQQKRLEVFQMESFQCRNCQSKTRTLHVHHHNYEKGKDPWDYDLSNFVSLCEVCHAEREKLLSKIKVYLGHLTNKGLSEVVADIASRTPSLRSSLTQ